MQDNAIHGAATDDIVRAQELGDVLEFPVEADTIIYQGSAVIMDGTSAGNASNPEDGIAVAGAGSFVGFALKRVDNRVGAVGFVGDAPGTGTAGAKRVRVQARGEMVLWILGSVATVGQDVYALKSNEFTVTKPAAAHGYFVGRVARLSLQQAATGGLTRATVKYDAASMLPSA
jgi:hypothetical protein